MYNLLTQFHIIKKLYVDRKLHDLEIIPPGQLERKRALKVRIKCELELDTQSSKTTNIHALKKQNSSSEGRLSMPQESW